MSNYNDIMLLKTIELEIRLVQNTYDEWYAIYKDNIKNKQYADAKKTLLELNKINTMLMDLVSRGRASLAEANKSGHVNIDIITVDKLNEVSNQLEYQQAIVSNEETEVNNIDGKLEISEQNQKTNYIQYVIIIVTGVIVMGLTAKTMITKDDSALDIAILVIVVGLAIYFLITNLIIE